MLQVRGKLLAESKGAAQQEERKKQRQQKTFGKEASCPSAFSLQHSAVFARVAISAALSITILATASFADVEHCDAD